MPLAVITFQPLLPIWLIVLLWAIAVGWSWLSLRGCGLRKRVRAGLFGLRAGAMTIMVWLLLEPERRHEKVESEMPVLAVALDVSASMTEKIAGQSDTRGDRVRQFLREGGIRSDLSKYRVWWFEIGDEIEEPASPPKDLEFNAAQSNLTPGLNRIAARIQAQNPAGIILLSDGLDQSGDEPSAELRTIPVYPIELENTVEMAREKPDVWIADVTYPQRAVVNWQAGLEVMLKRRGQEKVAYPVRMLQNGNEVQTSTVAWEAGETFKQVSFSITPKEVGQMLLRVEIKPTGEDAVAENNARDLMIDVTDPENRVLYLEGVPRWEFKFLKRALMSEKSVKLSAFVSTGSGGFITFSDDTSTQKDAVPVFTRMGLEKYKVVILGNLPADALKPQDYQGVKEFVDQGGGLLLLGGDQSYAKAGWPTIQIMQELMPAAPQAGARYVDGNFAITATSAGKAHPVLKGLGIESELPHLLSMYEPVRVSEFGTILLATPEGTPLLVTRPFGQGKVAMLLSDSFWRWQLGHAMAAVGKNLYQPFFAQLAQWLGPSAKDQNTQEMLQLLLAQNEVEVRRKVVVGARLESQGKAHAASLLCRVESPGGQAQTLPMVAATLDDSVGLTRKQDGYTCEFRPQLPGTYTISVTSADGVLSAKAKLLAREPVRERTGLPADRAYLERVAKATGGEFVAWKNRRAVFDRLTAKPRELRTVMEYPLWPKPIWILALITLFSLEWYWRRKLDFV